MAYEEIRMSTKILQIAGFLALLVCCYGQQHPSCKIWKAMAHHLSNQPRKQMTCFANDTNPCTSLRCSGTYKYTSWLLPNSHGIEVDYCFGMRLNHCDNPVSMDIYLVVPATDMNKKNISYFKRISHNTQLQIPGFTFSLKKLGTVDVFLYFHMIRNGSFVDLSITAKVRITSLGRLVMWPESMQKQIVPNEHIPVPPCSTHSNTTPASMTPLGGCHPPIWHVPTSPPGVSTTTENPFVTAPSKSVTYNRFCKEGVPTCGVLEMCDLSARRCICNPDFLYNNKLGTCVSQNHLKQPCSSNYQCGVNEMCNGHYCICQKGYTFKRQRQMCFLESSGEVPTTQVPVVTPQPHMVTTANPPVAAPSPNRTAIIAGAVVGGVVFLILVGLLVFFLVRRARSPYENREMLLADDTDGIM